MKQVGVGYKKASFGGVLWHWGGVVKGEMLPPHSVQVFSMENMLGLGTKGGEEAFHS